MIFLQKLTYALTFMIWSEAHVEHLRLESRIAVKWNNAWCVFLCAVTDRYAMSCFQWLTELILHCSSVELQTSRSPSEIHMTKAQCHFRHALVLFFLRESKAQISCIVRFFLSILYRRHSTGPSALINTSRREWLFLKMWRWRTCQFMPLYECFGMTACSASQCFCSSC